MTRYQVVCTGGTGAEAHGTVSFPSLDFYGGVLRERLPRHAAAPWPEESQLNPGDGEDVTDAPAKAFTNAESHCQVIAGSEQWEWRCQKCRSQLRLRGDHLRALLAELETPRIDLSRFRRA